MKKFMTMTIAAMAFVMSMSSCSSSNDDAPETPLATQVAGSYTGNEVIMVLGEESSNGTAKYEFAKSTDMSINMTIPQSGEMGHMVIPALPVKGITLTKSGNTITGKMDSYAGTVTNASGDDKAYTISGLTVMFSDKTVVVTFSLKYGNMPMSMDTTFTGTKN